MSDLSKIWPDWHVEEQLGKGSFGTVYKAVRRDHNIESYAAVKVISIPADKSEIDSLRSEGLDINATKTYLQGIVNDFVSEIQLMQSLKGVQNVVSVEDYTVVEKKDEIGWDIYIRMELLTPFNTYICDKTLTEKEVIKIGCDICTALELCSKRNIIHRDIKPENMFINDFGDFKLGDFGIARKLENMTGGLSQKGTAGYMAPEVVNSTDYDVRADIYSLGLVLYRLLNGNRLPFLRADQLLDPNERRNAVERRIRGEALPVPCNASPAMAQLILRACAFEPSQRFVSATDMKQALMSVANGTYQDIESDLYRTTPVDGRVTNLDGKVPIYSVREKVDQKLDDITRENGKSKISKIAVVVSIVAILVIVGVFVGQKMFDSSTEGTVGKSDNEVIIGSSDYSKGEEEEIATIISEAEELAVIEDYEGALAKVQEGFVTYPESVLLQEKVEEYTNALKLEVKEATLKEAEVFAEAEDYITAMDLIKNAQESYGDDEEYQNAYDMYNKAYNTQIKDAASIEADVFAQNGDYLEAIQEIEQAISIVGEDVELRSKAQTYEELYISEVISEVNVTIEEGNFDTADEIIDQAIRHFPDNDVLEEMEMNIENNRPKNLMAVCPPYETSGYKEISSVKMANENYTNGFTLNTGESNSYVLFNLGGKYKSLEFDLGHVDGTDMHNARFEIYLDGEVIETIEVNSENLPMHYTIPLDGAKQMKILSVEDAFWYPDYGFVNLVVYPSDVKVIEDISLSSDSFLIKECPPYETSGYKEISSVKMANENYSNGFTLNTGESNSYALFNLGGKYEFLEFDLGHVDETDMHNAKFEIYLDGEVVQTIEVNAEDLPKHYKIPLDGAKQMRVLSVEDAFWYPDYGFVNAVLY